MTLLFNGFDGSKEEKTGRQQKESFYSEMWGNTL